MKKILVDHFEELKKYPQKILMLIGIILIVVGLAFAPSKIQSISDCPISYLGLVIAILGLMLYIRKLFPRS